MGPDRVSGENLTIQSMMKVAQEADLELEVENATSKSSFLEEQEETVNVLARNPKDEKKLETHKNRAQQIQASSDVKGVLLPLEELESAADQFMGEHPDEYQKESLVLLRQQISGEDSKEKILDTLLKFYPDPTMANDVLSFLISTSAQDPVLKGKLTEIKEEFYAQNQREITAGQNIRKDILTAVAAGVGTRESLSSDYYNFTGSKVVDAEKFIDELKKKHGDDYDKIEQVIQYLFRALGADLRSPISSIPRPSREDMIEKADKISQIRAARQYVQVYKVFKNSTPLVESMFARIPDKQPQKHQ